MYSDGSSAAFVPIFDKKFRRTNKNNQRITGKNKKTVPWY